MTRPTMVRAAVVVGLLIAASVRATDLDDLKSTTPAERAAAQTALMTSRLGLTEAQVPKIAALNQKYAERMEPLLKGSDAPATRRRAFRSLAQEKEAELKEILSPEQYHTFQDAKREMAEQLLSRIKEQRGSGGK